MLGLKDKCIHPASSKPYVRSAIGGLDNSPEGKQDGVTHVFVMEFESEEDRNYYVEKDPVHLAFGKSIEKVVAKARVIDFVPGMFSA
jgi:hypothetical protein